MSVGKEMWCSALQKVAITLEMVHFFLFSYTIPGIETGLPVHERSYLMPGSTKGTFREKQEERKNLKDFV
jgi:hypothetical protein